MWRLVTAMLVLALLERAGVQDVVNVRGGWSAWTTRPCAEPDAQDLFHGEKRTAQ
jgi:3-mercaptopyruvate sulfurtransferase SseA